MNKEIKRKVVDVMQYNDRIIAFKLGTKHVDTFILQIYIPTSTHTNQEIEYIYEQIGEMIEMTNVMIYQIVLKDCNTVNSDC